MNFRWFKYKHNTQKSIPSIAKLISTVPDSNVKKCRLCQKTTAIFVPVCCNYILSKYLVGLNNRIFLFRDLSWSSYKDEVLFQHFTWEKLVYGRPSCTLFRFRVVIMTTMDHAVEEECRRILLEEGGRRRDKFHVFMSAVKMARLVNLISNYVVDIS